MHYGPVHRLHPPLEAAAVSELAALAPEVEASLGVDEDAAAPGPASVEQALADVVAALRSEGASGGSGAPLLLDLAERLAAPKAWLGVDRLVHDLVTDLVLGALAAPDPARGDDGRAFALRTLARHDALWPGAAARLGTAQSYDSILAAIRLRATSA
jgi:hypothetical protein